MQAEGRQLVAAQQALSKAEAPPIHNTWPMHIRCTQAAIAARSWTGPAWFGWGGESEWWEGVQGRDLRILTSEA